LNELNLEKEQPMSDLTEEFELDPPRYAATFRELFRASRALLKGDEESEAWLLAMAKVYQASHHREGNLAEIRSFLTLCITEREVFVRVLEEPSDSAQAISELAKTNTRDWLRALEPAEEELAKLTLAHELVSELRGSFYHLMLLASVSGRPDPAGWKSRLRPLQLLALEYLNESAPKKLEEFLALSEEVYSFAEEELNLITKNELLRDTSLDVVRCDLDELSRQMLLA